MENVGLFNEINPVYISLNMGRPSTPFSDDYVPQDKFRLIKREGLFLMGNRWMMINFLKCDYLTQMQRESLGKGDLTPTPTHAANSSVSNINMTDTVKEFNYILRIIAFENETSCQFSFDLNFNDLLILMQGNLKLLEDDNSHDLCQLILNSLSMITREKVDEKGRMVTEDILIVEHKIFFSEHYRSVYDKKNKNIMAKYDKKRQGLVKEIALETEFDTAVIYEAFECVY